MTTPSRSRHMTLLRTLLVLLLTTVHAMTVPASDPAVRPVTAAYTLGAGSAHLTDTYLTPLRYSGQHYTLGYSRAQAAPFAPERWTLLLDGSLGLDHTSNPARNATMWGLMLRVGWGAVWRHTLPCGLTLGAGPSLALEGGVLYSTRNGNNPASAKGAVTINLTGLAAYRLKAGHLPVTLLWRPSLPITGAFFSPDYGELYYEIYLGNHSGLAHAAWPGNYFCLDNQVTADLHLWRGTALRLGYSGRVFSSKASGIVTRMSTHAFVIGISGEWLSFNPSRPAGGRAIRAY